MLSGSRRMRNPKGQPKEKHLRWKDERNKETPSSEGVS